MAVMEKTRTAQPMAGVTCEIIMINPTMAEGMLGKNIRNRNLSPGTVASYARDMKKGFWKLTGETIKFDTKGVLLDGQHRLLACVRSGVAFESVVVRGIEAEAQDTMDCGRLRRPSDALALQGHGYVQRIAAAVRYLMLIKGTEIKTRVTTSEVMDMFNKHPLIEESAEIVSNAYGPSPAILTVVHYVGSHLINQKEMADDFVHVFVSGSSSEGCPALTWRERLIRMKGNRNPVGRNYMLYGTIHAWNMFLAGETSKMIRVPEDCHFQGLNIDKI